MSIPTVPVPPAPVMHPNEINAIYWQMFNNGQLYIGRLGSHPISIDEWRDLEMAKVA